MLDTERTSPRSVESRTRPELLKVMPQRGSRRTRCAQYGLGKIWPEAVFTLRATYPYLGEPSGPGTVGMPASGGKPDAAHHTTSALFFLMHPWECVGSERMNLQIPCR